MYNFCPNCGKRNDGWHFCPECGFDFASDSSPAHSADTKAQQQNSTQSFNDLGYLVQKAADEKRAEEARKKAEAELRRMEEERAEAELKRIEAEKAEVERIAREAEELRRRAEEENRRRAEQERIASLRRERNNKIVLLKDTFYVDECSDGTFVITGIIDEDESEFDIPDIVSKIGDNAFEECEIEEIEIPKGVTSIGDEAFQNCTRLTTITIPSSVETIGNDAFYGCDNLETIYIELSAALASHGISGVFPSGTLQVSFAIGVEKIGDNAFEECEIDEIEIPEGVTSIGDEAFQNCTRLTTITIPGSVETIGNDAFYGCDNLETVYLAYDSPLTKGDLIGLVPDDCEIIRK